MSGWGDSVWGGDAWGSGALGTLDLLAVEAFRENVLRFVFSNPIYFSRILDAADGSSIARYSVSVVAGSVGADGNVVRAVSPVDVGLSEGISPAMAGRFIDVTLDRPMTPFPAKYDATVNGIFSADLSVALATTTMRVDAVFKRLQEPTLETSVPSRDIANPQTRQAMLDPLPNPNNVLSLGTINVDTSGDHAFDEGLTGLKKRVLRRLVTSVGGFAHLPTYGVGIPDQSKRLSTSFVRDQLASLAESQIALEPDVAKVRVRVRSDPNTPGLVSFQVLVRQKSGTAQRFDVPFAVT